MVKDVYTYSSVVGHGKRVSSPKKKTKDETLTDNADDEEDVEDVESKKFTRRVKSKYYSISART